MWQDWATGLVVFDSLKTTRRGGGGPPGTAAGAQVETYRAAGERLYGLAFSGVRLLYLGDQRRRWLAPARAGSTLIEIRDGRIPGWPAAGSR